MNHKTLTLVLSLFVLQNVNAQDNFFNDLIAAKIDLLVQGLTAVQKTFIQLTLRDCTSVKLFLGYGYEQLKFNTTPNLSNVTLELYSGGSVVTTFNLTSNLSSQLLASSSFDISRPLTIFTPGYFATKNSPISRNMGSRLSIVSGHNVLVIDPSSVLGWFYYYSAAVVRLFGEFLGQVLADLHNGGVQKFHLIGHSLGAHISSFAGKTLTNLTGVQVDRISGLDPAGPCFFDENPTLKLNSNDAKFVDVIHSDAGTFGIIAPCGHVDFYPNGGDSQPSCLTFMCSHNKSWEFYHESMIRPTAFPAVTCSSWNLFKTGVCVNNTRTFMGYFVPETARGIFYLKTAATSPYGLQEAGITTPSTVDFFTSIWLWLTG